MPNDDESPINPENPAPGWHPDPLEGQDGLRWWNGKEWTDHTQPRPQQPQWSAAGPPPPPVKNNKNKIGWIVVGVIGAIFLVSALVNIGSSSGDDEKGRDSTPTVEAPADNRDWAILACHDSIENQLKDPESADYKNEAAIRQTGQTYDVSGMVNAKNSYGGMVGFRAYTCSATLDPDGETMRATASILE